MSLDKVQSEMLNGGVRPAAVATIAAIQSVNFQHQHLDCTPSGTDWCRSGDEPRTDGPGPSTTLEDLQPDVLYHILLFLTQQDVAHVKMCSSRLLCNILRACQHWAPKVESWLSSDPTSVGLLQQLRGAGRQQLQLPAEVGNPQKPPSLSRDLSFTQEHNSSSSVQASLNKQQVTAAAALSPHEAVALQGTIRAARGHAAEAQMEGDSCALTALAKVPRQVQAKLDWRQVWSCLERAQQGPWQLDARRLTPSAFPHGVLLTFEVLLEQPAPPAEPGAREQQSGGWKDCVTVVSFNLDGKAVDIMVDASGRVTSPQNDWSQGNIKLQAGQPKLLALEVSYLLPVAAWFLHPCTLAAPKLQVASSTGSLQSSSTTSSCASSMGTVQDCAWDSYSSTASSSASGGSMSIAHSAALCSAVSSLSFTSNSGNGSSRGDAASTAGSGRPRLCLDLSHGFGSYVSDPRYIDEASRNARPRGLERLEVSHRVCWRPTKVQSWLGRLLPGIRAAGCTNGGGSGMSTSTSGSGSSIYSTGSITHGGGCNGSVGGSSSSGGGVGGCVVGSPCGGSRHSSSRPSFAVTVSKAAVWKVPEDPEYRFMQGFAFWAVQHKAEQLLEHYGILPPWQGHSSMHAY